MKTTMKKIFSLMLVAVLLVGMLPFQASAEEMVPVTLEPGREYTVNDDFVRAHYTGSGTPVQYYVHNGALFGETFTAIADREYFLVIEEFAAAEEPDVCEKCNGSHKTAECSKIECTVCNQWTDHNADAHCNVCDALKSACPVTCPGNAAYVEPTPDPATVVIIINNAGTGKTFTIEAGKNVNDVYAAFKASGYAEMYKGATGPVLTLADSGTQVAATEAGNTYWLWLQLTEEAPDPAPAPAPKTCGVCGAAVEDDACTGCWVEASACQCCSECRNLITNHKDGCSKAPQSESTRGKIKITLKLNNGEKDQVIYADERSTMRDVLGTVPMTVPAEKEFYGWYWDRDFKDPVELNDRVPYNRRDGITLYAKWVRQTQSVNNNIDIRLNLNYDRKMGETLKAVSRDARMGDVLAKVSNPYRHGYKFAGWYWDADCKYEINHYDRVVEDYYRNQDHYRSQDHITIYAKWEHISNETMLKIYINGDTKNVAKIVDLHDYARDGWVTIDEVKEVVKQYYTSKDSAGLTYYGLFDSDNWHSFVRNQRHGGSRGIEVNRGSDTTIYVMVHNAKTYATSSGTADSTNPKTGDMIIMPAIILGVSASALAVAFYLNKKRAV